MMEHDRQDQKLKTKYQRAKAIEKEACVESMVLNARIYPNWIHNSRCFWYIRKSRKNSGQSDGLAKEYCLVDAESASCRRAFNHEALAKALSRSANRAVNPDCLPISQVTFEIKSNLVTFSAFNKRWIYNQIQSDCDELRENPDYWLVSPDGRKAVFLRDYNLWVRDLNSSEEWALTKDGVCGNAYGVQPQRVSLTSGLGEFAWGHSMAPQAVWSPDSRKILCCQTDERDVLEFPVTQYVPAGNGPRPDCVHTRYALPGDREIAKYRFLVIDIKDGRILNAQYPDCLDVVMWHPPFAGNRVWWSNNSRYAYFVDVARGAKQARVVEFNTNSGECQILFYEDSSTFIDLNLDFENPASLLPLPESDELIWFSERSGWAHIYLYDLKTGKLKKTITSGDWLVREVLHFDAKHREVFVQIAGRIADRNPYYRELCRVNIDTGNIISVLSDDYDYVVHKRKNGSTLVASLFNLATDDCSGISPDGNYIVSTRSRADKAPVTDLVDRNGSTVLRLESADISGLPQNWQWPEPVKLVAADGVTDIYGLIFRPSDFSPNEHYPVIDWAMNNPFYSFVPSGAFGSDYVYTSAAAYAELGFITVIIDGRGSCYRSKAFHDEAYNQMHTGSNLQDHIAGIRQLSKRYPYLDINRVGIVDTFGGNAPAYGMLSYPDFYKVGAAVSIWDERFLMLGEIYNDEHHMLGSEQSVLCDMAGNLNGKLLLIHGMLDPIYPVSGFLQLIEAFISENKDVDMVVLPNGGHAWNSSNYALRRVWDYLVTHLQDRKPPSQFQLSSGLEYATEKLQSELQ